MTSLYGVLDSSQGWDFFAIIRLSHANIGLNPGIVDGYCVIIQVLLSKSFKA